MDLKTYISDRVRHDALCVKLDTVPAYLYQLATARARPSAKMAKAIHEATEGVVPKHELRPDIFDPPA